MSGWKSRRTSRNGNGSLLSDRNSRAGCNVRFQGNCNPPSNWITQKRSPSASGHLSTLPFPIRWPHCSPLVNIQVLIISPPSSMWSLIRLKSIWSTWWANARSLSGHACEGASSGSVFIVLIVLSCQLECALRYKHESLKSWKQKQQQKKHGFTAVRSSSPSCTEPF